MLDRVDDELLYETEVPLRGALVLAEDECDFGEFLEDGAWSDEPVIEEHAIDCRFSEDEEFL